MYIVKFNKIEIFQDFYNLSMHEKNSLLSLFLVKSINRVSLTETINEINYLNSDAILNNLLELYLNFNIFYLQIELNAEQKILFKKQCFKIVECLVFLKIVFVKIISYKNKSLKE
jgi:hypothetical protein